MAENNFFYLNIHFAVPWTVLPGATATLTPPLATPVGH